MIIGAEKTGKTVFISRAIFDEYDSRYFPTVTEDSYRKSIVVGFQEHIVDILDVSGAKTSEVHYDRVTT